MANSNKEEALTITIPLANLRAADDTSATPLRVPADAQFGEDHLHMRMWKLERIRRRIPFAYWLFYDLVFVAVLVAGLHFSAWVWLAVPFLALATFFDVVEFIVKATEASWRKRLFEGTGAPTPRA